MIQKFNRCVIGEQDSGKDRRVNGDGLGEWDSGIGVGFSKCQCIDGEAVSYLTFCWFRMLNLVYFVEHFVTC